MRINFEASDFLFIEPDYAIYNLGNSFVHAGNSIIVNLAVKDDIEIEFFSNCLVAYLHISAICRLIQCRKLDVFTLRFDPIYNLEYNEDSMKFTRSNFSCKFCIDDVLDVLTNFLCELKIGLKEYAFPSDEFIEERVVRIMSDYVDIGYASC